MNLTPHEIALVELFRAMGAEPLHVSFTSTGKGVAFSIVTEGVSPVAGWGPTVEEAMGNAYGVPEPQPQPVASSRFQVVAGTDRRPG